MTGYMCTMESFPDIKRNEITLPAEKMAGTGILFIM